MISTRASSKAQNQATLENQFSRKMTFYVKIWAKTGVKKVRQKKVVLRNARQAENVFKAGKCRRAP